jgi:hypothetical protein
MHLDPSPLSTPTPECVSAPICLVERRHCCNSSYAPCMLPPTRVPLAALDCRHRTFPAGVWATCDSQIMSTHAVYIRHPSVSSEVYHCHVTDIKGLNWIANQTKAAGNAPLNNTNCVHKCARLAWRLSCGRSVVATPRCSQST